MNVVQLNRNTLEVVVKALRHGKIIVCPTDTVYGLVCDATKKEAVQRLFKIKGRPAGKPIPIFVKDINMAKRLAHINGRQEDFLRKHWPGRVTAVLKSRNKLPKILGAERSIGLRIPSYKFINDMLLEINCPLTGTSANISGKPSCWDVNDIVKQFKRRKFKPDLILDAGHLPKRKPSKVVDLTIYPPRVLRR